MAKRTGYSEESDSGAAAALMRAAAALPPLGRARTTAVAELIVEASREFRKAMAEVAGFAERFRECTGLELSEPRAAEVELEEWMQVFRSLPRLEELDPAAQAASAAAAQALEKRDAARQTLVSHNLRLVIYVTKRYRSLGVPFADLIQEANLGLIRAVDKFDPGRGFAFSTYAVWWIEQAAIRAIQRRSRIVRLPARLWSDQRRLRKAEELLRSRLGRDPTRDDLAAELSMDSDTVDAVTRSLSPTTSIHASVGEDGTTTLENFLATEPTQDPWEQFDERATRRVLRKALRDLAPRTRKILELRFGLRSGPPNSLQEIGSRLELSRERVRQIEVEALRDLRRHPCVRKLIGPDCEERASAG